MNDAYICGERYFGVPHYCNPIISEVGDNNVSCPVPVGVCSDFNASSGQDINWTNACSGSVACTQDNYQAFVDASNAIYNTCFDTVGYNGDCCDAPCTTLECFCPSSEGQEVYEHIQECNNTGEASIYTQLNYTKPFGANKYCYEDCLCCYTEACCLDSGCRPSIYASIANTNCCAVGCSNGGDNSSESSGNYSSSDSNVATTLSSFLLYKLL